MATTPSSSSLDRRIDDAIKAEVASWRQEMDADIASLVEEKPTKAKESPPPTKAFAGAFRKPEPPPVDREAERLQIREKFGQDVKQLGQIPVDMAAGAAYRLGTSVPEMVSGVGLAAESLKLPTKDVEAVPGDPMRLRQKPPTTGEEHPLVQAGEAMRKPVEEFFHDPSRPFDVESTAGKLGGGIGSTAALFLPTGAAGLAGKAAGLTGKGLRMAALAGTAAGGGALSGPSMYREVLAAGGSEQDAMLGFALSFGLGTLEGAPVAGMFYRLDRFMNGGLKRLLLTTTAQTVEEFAQEIAQRFGENNIAAFLTKHDEDRKMLDGMWAAGVEGASGGAFLGFLGHMLGVRQRGRMERQRVAAENQVAIEDQALMNQAILDAPPGEYGPEGKPTIQPPRQMAQVEPLGPPKKPAGPGREEMEQQQAVQQQEAEVRGQKQQAAAVLLSRKQRQQYQKKKMEEAAGFDRPPEEKEVQEEGAAPTIWAGPERREQAQEVGVERRRRRQYDVGIARRYGMEEAAEDLNDSEMLRGYWNQGMLEENIPAAIEATTRIMARRILSRSKTQLNVELNQTFRDADRMMSGRLGPIWDSMNDEMQHDIYRNSKIMVEELRAGPESEPALPPPGEKPPPGPAPVPTPAPAPEPVPEAKAEPTGEAEVARMDAVTRLEELGTKAPVATLERVSAAAIAMREGSPQAEGESVAERTERNAAIVTKMHKAVTKGSRDQILDSLGQLSPRLKAGAEASQRRAGLQARTLLHVLAARGELETDRARLAMPANMVRMASNVATLYDQTVSTIAPEVPVAETKAEIREAIKTGEMQEVEGEPWPVGWMEARDLVLRPKEMQYKLDIDKFGKVRGHRLQKVKKYDPKLAGIVFVWKDPETGQVVVVNGHQRVNRAKQESPSTPVKVEFIPADTVSDARRTGAMINIAEGSGTAMDTAAFMREGEGTTLDTMEAAGIATTEAKQVQASRLANLDDFIFSQVVAGTITEAQGAEIGRAAENEDQKAILSMYLKMEHKTNEKLKELVDEMGGMEVEGRPPIEARQAMLPGAKEMSQSQRKALEARIGIKAKVASLLRAPGRAFKAMSLKSNVEIFKRFEVEVDRAEAEGISVAAATRIGAFDQMKDVAGALNQEINSWTQRVVDGDITVEKAAHEISKEIDRLIEETLHPGQEREGAEGREGEGTAGLFEEAPGEGSGQLFGAPLVKAPKAVVEGEKPGLMKDLDIISQRGHKPSPHQGAHPLVAVRDQRLRNEAHQRIGNSSTDKEAPMTREHYDMLPEDMKVAHTKARIDQSSHTWPHVEKILAWSQWKTWRHNPTAQAQLVSFVSADAAKHGYSSKIPSIWKAGAEETLAASLTPEENVSLWLPTRHRGVRYMLNALGLEGMYPRLKNAYLSYAGAMSLETKRLAEIFGQDFPDTTRSMWRQLQPYKAGKKPDILKRRGRPDRARMMQAMMEGTVPTLPTRIQEIAVPLRAWFDEMDERAVQLGLLRPEQYIEDYIPFVKKHGIQKFLKHKGFNEKNVPKQYKPFFTMHRSGELYEREDDLGEILMAYVRAFNRAAYIDPAIQYYAEPAQEGEKNRLEKAVDQGKLTIDQYGAILEYFDHLSGKPSDAWVSLESKFAGFTRDLQQAVSHVPVLKNFELDSTSLRAFTRQAQTYLYAVNLGLRISSPIKNLTQQVHTAGLIGLRGWGRGFMLSQRPGMKKLIAESKVTSDFLPLLEGSVGLTGGRVGQMMQTTLFMFAAADTLNRSVTFAGAYQQFIDALRSEGKIADLPTFTAGGKFTLSETFKGGPSQAEVAAVRKTVAGNKAVAKLLTTWGALAGMGRRHQVGEPAPGGVQARPQGALRRLAAGASRVGEVQAIAAHLRDGDLHQAAVEYAKSVTYEAQYGYGTADSPLAWRHPLYRAMAAFHTWPMYITELGARQGLMIGSGMKALAKKGVQTLPGVKKKARLHGIDRRIQAGMAGMMTLSTMYLLQMGLKEAGEEVGIDVKDWFFRGSVPIPGTKIDIPLPFGGVMSTLPYVGGVWTRLIGSYYESKLGYSEYQRRKAGREFWRDAKGLLPHGRAGQGLLEMVTGNAGFAEGLGFKPYQSEAQKRNEKIVAGQLGITLKGGESLEEAIVRAHTPEEIDPDKMVQKQLKESMNLPPWIENEIMDLLEER